MNAPLNEIVCPKCGRDVHDRAPACPHCGEPIYVISPGEITPTRHPPLDQHTPRDDQD
jgi:rRNA maturation protein Nop10